MKHFAILTFAALAACATQPGPVKRQMIGLLEKFDRWDYNGDGQLSESELKEAEELSGMPAAEIIRFYDTSGNQRISLAEAQAGMSRLGEARETVKEIEEAR
jgi:Ca2+-binding EF-hand superfamily protein